MYSLVWQTLLYSPRDRNRWGGDLGVIAGGRNISTAAGPVNMDVLAGLKFGVLLSGEDAEGVCAEVITLGLKDVGGDDLAPVTVQEGESSRESGSWDAPENGLSDDTSPAGLCLADG